MRRFLLLAIVAVVAASGAAPAQESSARPPLVRTFFELAVTIDRQELRLEAMEVRPRGPGPFPLAVIAHGKASGERARRLQSPSNMAIEAVAFARRGFLAVVAMRRGYGASQGRYAESDGECEATRYAQATRAGGRDLVAIVAAAAARPDVDRARILVVGQSVGGIAALALATAPPPGVLGVVNFSGGRGHDPKTDTVCQQPKLVDLMRGLGKAGRVPTLWVYAQNDRFFPPELARAMADAYVGAGGRAGLVVLPPVSHDGHLLSRIDAAWAQPVDAFLRSLALPALPPQPAPAPPATLGPHARDAFAAFARSAVPFRAFARAPTGAPSWVGSTRSLAEARRLALAECQKAAPVCDVVAEISEIEDR